MADLDDPSIQATLDVFQKPRLAAEEILQLHRQQVLTIEKTVEPLRKQSQVIS